MEETTLLKLYVQLTYKTKWETILRTHFVVLLYCCFNVGLNLKVAKFNISAIRILENRKQATSEDNSFSGLYIFLQKAKVNNNSVT